MYDRESLIDFIILLALLDTLILTVLTVGIAVIAVAAKFEEK